MKLRRKLIAAASSLAVTTAVLLAGCGASQETAAPLSQRGALMLSVNPEIQIE